MDTPQTTNAHTNTGDATREQPAAKRTRAHILRRLRSSGRATVKELAAELDVAAVTVHRHLAALEVEGLIARPRGGAQLLAPPDGMSAEYAERLSAQPEAKEAIARRALAFLPPQGGAVFLDASTTCLYLAREIARSVSSELTIVTTSPAILHEFASGTVRVIAVPGELDQQTRVIGGPWAVEFLASLHVEAAFISGIGLTLEAGLTSQRRAVGDVLKEVVEHSPRTYMLVDHTKFGRTGLLRIAWPWHAAAVISDGGLPPEQAAAYAAREAPILIAGPSP